LPQVRCPECGALNDTRAPDYPFCVGCQDNLAKCGYCYWFDEQAGVCMHSAVGDAFEVSAAATPPCSYHAPRVALRVRREGRPALLLVVGVTAALFALAYGSFKLLGPGTSSGPPPGNLQLSVEAGYENAIVGQPYLVTAEVYNISDVVVRNVRFEIAKASLAQLQLRTVRPQPMKVDQSRKWQVLVYPDMNPRQRRTITLELVPKKAGAQHLVLQLTSGPGAYHGMTDLPVLVCGRRPGTASGGRERYETR
jgi:hypothetical protein